MANTGLRVRVLIADDEQALRESMRTLLEDAGYPVLESVDGRSTLETLRASPDPLVVLLDLVMPQNGHRVIEAIGEDPVLARRHIYVLCTARVTSDGHLLPDDARQAEQILARGGIRTRLVAKPFDIDDLLAAVDAAATDLMAMVLATDPSAGQDSVD